MGKRNRHTKNVKSERSKTKLKNAKTKFLPKGQNVTNVSFKIKPIVLQQQLRSSTGELLSSRKLSVKEILTRLKHHNESVKAENCQQLRELISSNLESMQQHLSQIFQGICPLFLDRDRRVRKEAVKVLDAILKDASANQIETFISNVVSFLCCAMTHIDRNIQEDSLFILDCLLDNAPSLIAKNVGKLLPNFFVLISKIRSDSKPGRTLTESLQSQQTGVKWRVNVLTRLKKILDSIHSFDVIRSEVYKQKAEVFDMTSGSVAPLYVDRFRGLPFDFNEGAEAEKPAAKCVDVLMPLLHEAWLEVAPSYAKIVACVGMASNTVLSEESWDTLSCILSIYYLLMELANGDPTLVIKFESKAAKRLLYSLLTTFPHSQKITKGVSPMDAKCLRENLLLCYIFATLNKKLLDEVKAKSAFAVLKYLNRCLLNRNYVNGAENTYLLLKLLKRIYLENLPFWKKARLDMDEFVANIVHFYNNNANVPKEEVMEMYVTIYDIVKGNSKLTSQLAEMADGLCLMLRQDKIPVKVVDSFLLLVKKNTIPLQNSLRCNMQEILDNACEIKITGVEHIRIGVVKLLSLFYYTPLLEEHCKMLQSFGDEFPDYADFVNYILNK